MNLEQEKEIQNSTAFKYDSVYSSLISYKNRWFNIYDLIKKDLNKEKKIIEVGCGTATFLSLLENKGYYNLFGLDLAEKTIEFARKNKTKNVLYESGSMTESYFQNHKFDHIFFMGSLHHLDDIGIKKSLEIALTKLKENGIIFILDGNESHGKLNIFLRILRKILYIKNFKHRRKWQFNPRDSKLYTIDHKARTPSFYKNILKSKLELMDEIYYENYQANFEGVLFDNKFDNLFYKLCKLIDSKITFNEFNSAQFILKFQRKV